MAEDPVRMWRPADDDRVLLMAGRTADYAMEPRGEYVFGVVEGQPMRSRRARERRLVAPGHLVAWDPSDAHSGTAVDGRGWFARLMVIDVAHLTELTGDAETGSPLDVCFPDPVIRDAELITGFLALHGALETSCTRLERDVRLAGWLRALTERAPSVRPERRPLKDRDTQALRRAREYLAEQPERNIGLDELSTVAGIGKFRLIRLFRERTGLTPHALQVAHRLRIARRLLEAGRPIAEAATAAGFADQSHLHRHLRRSLGVTPAQYQRRFGVRGVKPEAPRALDGDGRPCARCATPAAPAPGTTQDAAAPGRGRPRTAGPRGRAPPDPRRSRRRRAGHGAPLGRRPARPSVSRGAALQRAAAR